VITLGPTGEVALILAAGVIIGGACARMKRLNIGTRYASPMARNFSYNTCDTASVWTY
jgi:hypothetical protein